MPLDRLNTFLTVFNKGLKTNSEEQSCCTSEDQRGGTRKCGYEQTRVLELEKLSALDLVSSRWMRDGEVQQDFSNFIHRSALMSLGR